MKYYFHNKQAQDGFTLIELMIVVAIIAILAAIAIPAYQDYVVRSRVSEGLIMASAAKINVADVFANGNPTTDADGYGNGYDFPAAGTQNVDDVTIDASTGVVTVDLSASSGNGLLLFIPNAPMATALPNGVTDFTPLSDPVEWKCSVDGTDAGTWANFAVGTLPSQYAPASCR